MTKNNRREYNRLYYQKNKEKILSQHRDYYRKNSKKMLLVQKLWSQENKEKVKEIKRNWAKNNPNKVKISHKKWRLANPEKLYIRDKEWRIKNPEKSRKKVRDHKRRIRSTVNGRLEHRMETAIGTSLRKNKKGRKWEILVGYTVEELRKHLEKQFKEDMNWDKLMKGEIVIDHKIPKSWFIYVSPDDLEFKRCWSLNNLQPMEKMENLKKHNRAPLEILIKYILFQIKHA